MAWGSDTAATQLTAITTEQFFDQVPTLNPRETVRVQVSVDFPASPTDHALVAVYTTLDDASEVWDLGSTDTITSADLSLRRDGVNA